MEVSSSEFFMKASMEASMEDMEDMKASTEVTYTGASTKASMEVMEAFVEVMKAFMKNLPRKSSWKLP